MKKGEYRHKDQFVVTSTTHCDHCHTLKPDVRERDRIQYWKYTGKDRKLTSCGDCHAEDGRVTMGGDMEWSGYGGIGDEI